VKKSVLIIAVISILALILPALTGCQQAGQTTTKAPATTTPISTTTTAISTTTPVVSTTASPAGTTPADTSLTITDDLGREVKIKGVPQRIISLAPSNTEMVYALGLEDRLIGVTTYCNYPETAKNKTQVSDYSQVDIEKIVSLQPDLILADRIHKAEVIPALEKLGITTVAIFPSTVDEIFKDMELIGRMTGQIEKTASLVAGLRSRVQGVADKIKQTTTQPRVLFVTWHDPIWTAGSDTMIDELIRLSGGANIASGLREYATITMEEVIDKNPQIIIVMSSMGDGNVSLDYINSEPRLQVTEALKNKQVYIIDSDIFGRTSPRIVDGLETLAQIVHPEAFK